MTSWPDAGPRERSTRGSAAACGGACTDRPQGRRHGVTGGDPKAMAIVELARGGDGRRWAELLRAALLSPPAGAAKRPASLRLDQRGGA
ncbi:unnamed protein product [Urochloa humidicola]